jgi:hypothetical protein
VYLVLYLSDGWLQLLPAAARPSIGGGRCSVLWTGRHILHITTEIDVHRFGTGSGDTLLDYIRVLNDLAIASVATLVWSLAVGRRRDAPALHQWLRVYVRYPLGIIMLGYGMAKVFPGQFGTGILPLDRLLEPYGHSSPMGILWTFMGTRARTPIFCGLAEVGGRPAALLAATTTLGALIVAASMANVVTLNFSYDVPVKLFSTHLFLLAVFLLLPDLGRLARVFVLNRPTAAAPERPPFTRVWPRRAAVAVKTLLIGFVLYQNTWPNVQLARRPRTVNPRYGHLRSRGVHGERSAAPRDADGRPAVAPAHRQRERRHHRADHGRRDDPVPGARRQGEAHLLTHHDLQPVRRDHTDLQRAGSRSVPADRDVSGRGHQRADAEDVGAAVPARDPRLPLGQRVSIQSLESSSTMEPVEALLSRPGAHDRFPPPSDDDPSTVCGR